MPWSHGTFYWNELMTWDVDQAKRFYADTLDWSFAPMAMPDGTYWVIKCGDATVGGMFQMSKSDYEGLPEAWMGYIAVDDIDARIAKATEVGGTLMRPPFDVPGVGRIALLQEPGRAAIGWITPANA
jgi:uncharacterized protein